MDADEIRVAADYPSIESAQVDQLAMGGLRDNDRLFPRVGQVPCTL